MLQIKNTEAITNPLTNTMKSVNDVCRLYVHMFECYVFFC
jgi:hypothetical protein